ncbi:MAG: UvrD-helicase domain-containing protein [Desulfovibrionales bacterium]|nr:UvrD-helicase domain-containing protein [Desulfovibrionales bacterium]
MIGKTDMEFIADLHIHSYLSRATARNLNLENLHLWAQLKGITVVGTGDFTHPQWFSEIREKLEPAEPGLLKLKRELASKAEEQVPSTCKMPVRFLLSVEISNIYKKNGKVRKVHNIVFSPDLSVAEKINARLARIGNIRSDGRPILGLDSKALLETVLDISEDAFVIPAHIWTPWFSALGSKSGFDSLEECFEELTPHIFAAETGLSSDPAMNWRVSKLDGVTLVSNSDAHSPANLGREANLFDTGLSYFAMRDALKTGDPGRFLGTIEFFPEEGKYHFDGHRKCATRLSPRETMGCKGLCPVCGKPVTIGVMYRVEELADRNAGQKPEKTHPFTSLIPLTDILSEVLRCGPKSKKVQTSYHQLLRTLGPELDILRKCPLSDIESEGSPTLAEAIRKMRGREVHIDPGYDGEYGKVRLFTDEELTRLSRQQSLFQAPGETPMSQKEVRDNDKYFLSEPPPPPLPSLPPTQENVLFSTQDTSRTEGPFLNILNSIQREAVRHAGRPLLIVAGPGTGKTRTITHRIAYLLSHHIAQPEQILAVTFTNKAAEEMRDRLTSLIKDSNVLKELTIKTFHALCLDILRRDGGPVGVNKPFTILTGADQDYLIKGLLPSDCSLRKVGEAISKAKQNLLSPGDDWEDIAVDIPRDLFGRIYEAYQRALDEAHLLDFEDLIFKVVRLLEGHEATRAKYQKRFRFISVDEYQDINYAQYRLIRLMAPSTHDLCVIGDPDQAIYGFRGSSVRYFHKFQEDYPTAKFLRLEQNYRSTETILRASRQVIGGGDVREGLWSGIQGTRWLTIAQLPTEKAEAEFVVKSIETEVRGISHFSMESRKIDTSEEGGERSFSDFAVLYRINEQGKALEEAFIRSGIPFQRVGKEKIVDRKGTAQLLFCLRTLEPFGCGLDRLEFFNRKRIQGLKDGLNPLEITLKGKTVREKLKRIYEDVDLFRNLSKEAEFQEDICYLLSFSERFGDNVSDFLTQLALQGEADLYDPRAEKVTLMTLHAAKGLEFPVVFITGCEEGLIPYYHYNKETQSDISEERRLFYVGLTRTQEKLFLSYAGKRLLFGTRSSQKISPFLQDIGQELKKYEPPFSRKPLARIQDAQLSLFDKN